MFDQSSRKRFREERRNGRGGIFIYIAHFLQRKYSYEINFAMVSSTPENPLLKKEYFLKNDWRPLYKGAVSRLKEHFCCKNTIYYTVQYEGKMILTG